MAKYRYVRASGVRQLAKDHGKRVGTNFIFEIDKLVYEVVCRCCKVFNGHKTLDSSVAQHVIGNIKR